jgi:hypothetical protein
MGFELNERQQDFIVEFFKLTGVSDYEVTRLLINFIKCASFFVLEPFLPRHQPASEDKG